MTRTQVRLAFAGLIFLCGLRLHSEPVSRTPPAVYLREIAPLLTPLGEALKNRTSFPESESNGVVLLDEVVRYRDSSGLLYRAYHNVNLARRDAAAEVMGNRIFSYDRDRESIFLVTAGTVRPDGSHEDLDDRAAFIQSPQHEAENGLYTHEQELNLIFPKIAAGAVTESVVLIREDKPAFPGELATHMVFGGGWPTARVRLVLDLPGPEMQRLHLVSGSALAPSPTIEAAPTGRARKIWTRDNIAALLWEEAAPSIEFRAPTVWLSTLDSWDQVARWYSGLTTERTVLGAELEKEVDRWTAGLKEPTAIVERLCAVVANEVRYTGLDFGMADYQPYPCAQVWANRYGDCKDKANLLRAMLARKGIKSYLVLLQTDDSGQVEKRSPSWRQFDHAILAVDEGRNGYVFCDPTVKHLPAGHLGRSDRARPVLVLHEDRAEWVQTPDDPNDAIRIAADLELTSSGELSGWFSLKPEGSDAAGYAEYYENFDPPERRRTLQRLLEEFFPGAELIDLKYQPPAGSMTTFELRAFLIRKPGAAVTENLAFPYPAAWLPTVDTNTERKFPYAPARRTESLDVSIKLPAGWNAGEVPEAFHAFSPAARFEASWTNEPGRLRAQLRWSPEGPEIRAPDYAVYQRSVRALRAWLEHPIRLVRGEATADKAQTVLSDFPLLATAEGQMKLLDQRFPSGGRDGDRRAALQQVIQWFPDDIGTVFDAKVSIALIDGASDNAQLARLLRALLAQYGTKISIDSRSWAKFIADRAGWQASHDPDAIADLKAMAADPANSEFRRSWSAYNAALYLSENEPKQALALLAQFDSGDADALSNILKLEASILARQNDTASTRQWAERLVQQWPPQDADSILEGALTDLAAKPEGISPAALTTFTAALEPSFAKPTILPKTAAILTRLQSLARTARLRSEFVATVGAWLDQHPVDWITPAKSAKFTDLAAVEKHLEEMNDAHNGRAVIDAFFQLARYHDSDYPAFAKYLYWTSWWLEHDKLEPEMFAMLVAASYALPTDATEYVIDGWLRYAQSLLTNGRQAAAREVFARILASPGVRPFQRAEAYGEIALQELAVGHYDPAIAAFDSAAKDLLEHKRCSEYLYVAVLLDLELGRYDSAQSRLVEMTKDEAKYRDAARFAQIARYLVANSTHPDELRQYWRRSTKWIPAWDTLLQKYGVAPASVQELTTFDDFQVLQKKIATDSDHKDLKAYLHDLDQLVRVSRWIPIVTINACNQASRAANISPELFREVREFFLLPLDDFPALDDDAYRGSRIMRAAFCADLGHNEEARQIAEKLYTDYGAGQPAGAAGLRVWLLAEQTAGDTAKAVAAATQVLASGTQVSERALTVQTLSDALLHRNDDVAHITLLERETQNPEIQKEKEMLDRLTARLTSLQAQRAADGEFSGAVTDWLRHSKLEWLIDVPPTSLSQPRYANPTKDEVYTSESGLSFTEALKCNLLVALDDARPLELRHRALESLVFAVAELEVSAFKVGLDYHEAASLKNLPDRVRRHILSAGLTLLLKDGHAAEAETLLNQIADPAIQADFRKAFAADFEASRALADFTPERARFAFTALAKEPLASPEVTLLRTLLFRLVYAGETKTAEDLVAGAASLHPEANTGLSANGLRLDWTRMIRRETANRPFYLKVREILGQFCPPQPGDAEIYRSLSWRYGLQGLSQEARARAVSAAFGQNLFTDVHLAGTAYYLSTARTLLVRQRDFGPELETAVLDSTLDEPTRAEWLDSIWWMCDADILSVRIRIEKATRAFLARPDIPLTARSRTVLRTQLAYIALRTSDDPRPEDLFGESAVRELTKPTATRMQFAFLCSRRQTTEAESLLDQIDADELSAFRTFPYAFQLFQTRGRESELKLLLSMAREKIEQHLTGYWLEAQAGNIYSSSIVANLADASDLLPEALFDQAITRQADPSDRDYVQLARSILRRDWSSQEQAADQLLTHLPEYYDAMYHRGEARFHLGKLEAARPDLELFLEKAKDSFLRSEAERMLAEIAKAKS